MSESSSEYFGSLPVEDLTGELISRSESYYNYLLTSGRLARWRIAFDSYYGSRGKHDSSWVQQGGEQGELYTLMVNEYRNLIQHILALATQERPDAECIAANSDSKSQAQAILGNSLLETYFKEKKVERVMVQSMETAMIMDTAWTIPMWNPNLGDVVGTDPDTGKQHRNGDIYAVSKTPLEVVIDWTNHDPNRNDWIIVKDRKNKFDLAASYPEKREQILRLTRDTNRDALFDFGDKDWQIPLDSDEIDVHTFLHEKTDALPEGRMTTFFVADKSLWTFDGPLPFKKIPGVRVCPNEKMLSAFGYSNANDLLALQDIIDALYSATTTNITAAGVNNIWVKKGNQISYDEIAKGMSFIESDDKPEVLILNEINPQVLKFIEMIHARMEGISGVNAVSRGNVSGQMSGAAMALVQSMAIQFNSPIKAAYTHQIEDVGTLIIEQLQDFAQEERLAIIAGKSKAYMARYFSSKDLESISRVIVKQGNAYRNSTAGRAEIANNLLDKGIITDAEQYLQVIETGNIDPAIEGVQNVLMTIRAENEALANGQQIQAMWTDNPQKHILGHIELAGNPATREDPELVARITEHIQMHVELWLNTNPLLLQLLGYPPPPMMGPEGMGQMMQPPPLPQGPALQLPGGQGGEQNAMRSIPQALGAESPMEPGLPSQPSLPTNPLSGEKFDATTGGLPANQVA